MQERSGSQQQGRTVAYAERLLEELRYDMERAILAGLDTPPRLRSIHEKPGHSTPEFRTLMVPPLPGQAAFSPETLSAAIACFAARCPAERLVLALDALRQDASGLSQPVLIAEARDVAGTRLFWQQPYAVKNGSVTWDEPLNGGWVDPGSEELILDAAFNSAAARRSGTSPGSC